MAAGSPSLPSRSDLGLAEDGSTNGSILNSVGRRTELNSRRCLSLIIITFDRRCPPLDPSPSQYALQLVSIKTGVVARRRIRRPLYRLLTARLARELKPSSWGLAKHPLFIFVTLSDNLKRWHPIRTQQPRGIPVAFLLAPSSAGCS